MPWAIFVPRLSSSYPISPLIILVIYFVLDFPLPLCHFSQICLRNHSSSAAFWDSGSN
ncbi:hypothetical protein BDV38DRAFT_258616 [Aspergillus pseudotamarii]|uniref:Uncharacterized protein n=1 Tax=Aspergillus pseudotamarii TaxID=132259 RepID=A0A5N6SFB1_ASPPS|nr:uncharacterized protein BDV38DRAFT_258616 [Aspergillus pseudotamarii]KAE8133352.1 hypothetical protein BDV38DRAFT_258616 [Aspergillus pseudotamarii]